MLRLTGFVPLAIVVQGLFALGIVAGYPLLFPELDRQTMLFLATGAPAITLITMGVVAVPQLVAQAKTEGTLDYMRALPGPRGPGPPSSPSGRLPSSSRLPSSRRPSSPLRPWRPFPLRRLP